MNIEAEPSEVIENDRAYKLAGDDKRKPLYDQLNDFLLDEQFVIVVVSNAESVVSRANVQGIQWDLHGARRYADMWLA